MDEKAFAKNFVVNGLLNKEFKGQDRASSSPNWLISVQASAHSALTSGDVSGYSDYGILNSYREELKVINRELSGDGGIYASNVIINIPSDYNSINLFQAFSTKTILDTIKLVQIVSSSTDPVTKQEITYNSCRIEKYANLMDSVELSINYASRDEKYNQYSNGSKTGQIVSSFSA